MKTTNSKDLRIVFLGTPDFAAYSLKQLISSGYNIVAIVTAPDKPAGRGMQLQQSAVKKVGIEHNIPVLQPEKLKNPDFLQTLASYKADIQIVIAFRMLPKLVWNMPPMGTINLHASLLPEYRGAAPINWAIINGEHQTGVTTFKLKHEIDTGDLLKQHSVEITPGTTAGELHDILMIKGSDLIQATINELASGTLKPIPQGIESTKHAPKLFTKDCEIDWNKPGMDVVNLIHGLSPFPGAFTHFNDKVLKIYKAHFEPEIHNHPTGKIFFDIKKHMKFTTPDGYVYVSELQLAGKKRMQTAEFTVGLRNLST
jgi:methionyl-tRNA formyltransferase